MTRRSLLAPLALLSVLAATCPASAQTLLQHPAAEEAAASESLFEHDQAAIERSAAEARRAAAALPVPAWYRTATASGLMATITVNTLAGDNDGVCGTDGADPVQDCSIREAVTLANSDAAMDMIAFSVSGTIPLGDTVLPIEAVEIDGTTAPDGSGSVFLDGQDAVLDVIRVSGGTGTIIRGLTIGQATRSGVALFSPTSQAQVVSNYIGTNASGADLGNASIGVLVQVADNTIGGAGAGNTIGFNGNYGVILNSAIATGNVVSANFIGTDASGADLGNRFFGVFIADGASDNTVGGAGAGNTIGFNSEGVFLRDVGTTGNVVAANWIGTNADGADLGNATYGVLVGFGASDNTIGGVGMGNTIGFSGRHGVDLRDVGTTGNVVAANWIGTNADGADLGNAYNGVYVGFGVSGNTIGGAGAGNTIGFNGIHGVSLQSAGTTGNVVAANFIGTDAAGADLGNRFFGVFIADGASDNTVGGAGAGNTIGFNSEGVFLRDVGTTGNVVAANWIGTNADGADLGNTGSGVIAQLGASDNTIGGTAPGAGNTVRFNAKGIEAYEDGGSTANNAFLGNAVWDNDDLGIDLGEDGVTANDPDDADDGPNGLQNYPVLTSATASGGDVDIAFTLDSTPEASFRVELFASGEADPSGFGEGARFVGATTVATDADGDASGSLLVSGVAEGEVITATATPILSTSPAVYGGTSEFSAALSTISVTLTGTDGWRMLAVPSTSETVQGFLAPVHTQGFPGASTTLGQSNVYFYDETASGGLANGYTAPEADPEPLAAGRGLFAYVFADDDPSTPEEEGGFDKVLPVSGAEPDAPFAFAPTFTDSGAPEADGWNLLGNPFAAGMDWDASGWTKTDVSNAIYVWDPASEEYLTHNGIGGGALGSVVASFQGFWNQATGASPALVAPAAARTPGGGTFQGLTASGETGTASQRGASQRSIAQKSATDAPVIGLRITRESGGTALQNHAWVSFSDHASLGRDRFDAFELASMAPEAVHLFWREPSGIGLDIVAVPQPSKAIRLPLDVALAGTASGGRFTLAWPTVPEGWKGVLLDRETGTKTNIIRESSYSFELAPEAGATLARAASSEAIAPLLVPPSPRVIGAPEASGVAAKGARAATRFVLIVRPLRSDASGDLDAMSVADLEALGADELGGTPDAAPSAATASAAPEATSLTAPPDALALLAPAPNPARGVVTLGYDVPLATEVSVVVYDALGRAVAVATSGEHAPGRYAARVALGGLAPGVYVARMTTPAGFAQTQRLTILH